MIVIKVEIDLNDEKWNSLMCETSDEMDLENMDFKIIFWKSVWSSKESIVEVVSLLTCPSEKREKVRTFMYTKIQLCYKLSNFGVVFLYVDHYLTNVPIDILENIKHFQQKKIKNKEKEKVKMKKFDKMHLIVAWQNTFLFGFSSPSYFPKRF
ncbi:hypothetical protein RFI_19755 [Reticulomyxa filosa]|uniref:Uncharacterized protein n=1 Tax=Reticulomyxa filosa TaxID=46433 RepID=X6MVT0_RETFI|nr:hypothetical protein RFI_19755 [Reticulomyxa filosa]|eukprot:ETO17567.1 hypothetical protein RFI_19755 [Reticulomyxa filosa]